MNRKRVYICSPLRGDYKANMERARRYCRQMYNAGYNPICPHIYYTQFLDDTIPEERKDGLELALNLLRSCQTVVVCGDTRSDGMMTEIALAQRLGKTVTTLDGILAVLKSGR